MTTRPVLDALPLDRLVDLAEAPEGGHALVAGMVVSLKPFTTRKGQAMAFLEVEDRIMRVEAVGFPTVWKRHAVACKAPAAWSLCRQRCSIRMTTSSLSSKTSSRLTAADQDLAEQVRRLERQARARTPRAGARRRRRRRRQAGAGPHRGPLRRWRLRRRRPAQPARRSQRLRGSAAAQRAAPRQ